MTTYGSDSDEELLKRFGDNFSSVASIQGRVAYLLMSMHTVNPSILQMYTDYDPSRFLYTNMVYGIGIMIYSRPNMKPIGFINRLTFSILGSLMFNYSSVGVFNYLREQFAEKPFFATFLGFISGRFFMLHLLAYLYHIDTRSRDRSVARNAAFDSMYIN